MSEKVESVDGRDRERRPWGEFVVLSDEPDHKVKRISVLPGQRLSLQRHRQREEHWFVIQGKGIATLGGGEVPLARGEALDIPRLAVHRIVNPGPEVLVFIEVQLGDYFGEDDIERFADDYGRVT